MLESWEHHSWDKYWEDMKDDERTSRNVSVSITTVGSKEDEESDSQDVVFPQ